MKHISTADLDAMRGGSLSASEAGAIGAHVASCALCAALVDEALAIEHSARALDAELSGAPASSPAVVAASRAATGGGWRYAIAAVLAAAAITAMVLIPWNRTVTPPPTRPRVTVTPAVPKTTPPPATRAMPPAWRALVDQVRSTKRLPFPADLRELAEEDAFRGGAVVLASARVWPAATAVEELRPLFAWTQPANARSTVTLRRASDGRIVERGTRLTKPRWRPVALLERGVMYVWQVHVVHDGQSFFLPAPPAPPAMFRVIGDREHDELRTARKFFPDDHLLLALLYARAGVGDAAKRELERYAAVSRDPLAAALTAQLPSAQ